MNKTWKKYNDEAEFIEDYNDYINERGFQIIRNAEGHFDGPKEVGGIITTYYGVTQKGIDGLEKLSRSYNTKVPDWILKADVNKITEKEAKEITGYIAMLNTKLVDDLSDCNNFSEMDIDTRSMFLTYLHNVSPYSMRKSYQEGQKGSFLAAVRGGNPYLMSRALIQKADGSVMDEFNKNPERSGLKRRAMLPMFALGNKSLTFNTEDQISLDNRFKQPGFVKECYDRLTELSNDYDSIKTNEYNRALEIEAGKLPLAMSISDTKKTETEAQNGEENGGYMKFATDFTNWLKNYFTGNNKEDETNVTGNKNVDMQ